MKDHHKIKGLWILLAITLVSMAFINVPLSPAYGEQTKNTNIVFRSIGTANKIIVDDNQEFTSPQLVTAGAVVTLKPGTYYWKTTGMSLVNTFTILSEVALEVEQEENNYKM